MKDKAQNNVDEGQSSVYSVIQPNQMQPSMLTESIEQNQISDTMEVHQHPHHGHGKKDWKSYIWEFLMLFLAVFCGFLAEYQLEHKIERDRAKELAKHFYDELENDSITAQLKVKNRLKQEKALKDLVVYFKDSSLTQVSKKFALDFEYGVSFRSPSQFEPRTIVLEQLKNSGSLRYFKNDKLQKLVGDITVVIRNIYDRQALETQTRLDYLNPIIMKHYDYAFDARMKEIGQNVFEGVNNYENSNETIPYHINGVENLDRQAIINVLNLYHGNIVGSTRENFINKYIEINAELLQLLRQEYKITGS